METLKCDNKLSIEKIAGIYKYTKFMTQEFQLPSPLKLRPKEKFSIDIGSPFKKKKVKPSKKFKVDNVMENSEESDNCGLSVFKRKKRRGIK